MSYSMPLGGSLYPRPPWEFRDALACVVPFEANPGAVAKIVPEPLEVPENPRLFAWVNDYPFVTGLGPFKESFITIEVSYNGVVGSLVAFIYTTSDTATAGGREVGGTPKKNANISLKWESELAVGRVERCGITIMTTAVLVEKMGKLAEKDLAVLRGPLYSVKLIPSSIDFEARPSVHEIVALRVAVDKVDWLAEGEATVSFESSPADPLYLLSAVNVFRGYLYKYSYGKKATAEVVYRYPTDRG
jgi:acetoacetate decarboxylase